MLVGASTVDTNSALLDTGAVYMIRGDRAPLAIGELPTTTLSLTNSPIGDFLERSSSNALFVHADSLQANESTRWYRFTTVGDGQLGDFVRILPSVLPANQQVSLTLYTLDGKLVASGPQALVSLDRVATGSYLLAVSRLTGTPTTSQLSFGMEIQAPLRNHTMRPLFNDRDTIHGGDGNDFLVGGSGLDRIFGAEGQDNVKAEAIEFFDAQAGQAGDATRQNVDAGQEASQDVFPRTTITIDNVALLRGIASSLGLPTRSDGTPLSPLTPEALAQVNDLRVDSQLSRLGIETAVNSLTTGAQRVDESSAVGMAANGSYVVVWRGPESIGSSISAVWGQRYSANGEPLGSEFRVNTTSGAGRPHVGMNPTGEFVVAWSDTDANNDGVRARRYAADGTPRGNDFRVNQFTTNAQQAQGAAIDAFGNTVIVFNSFGQDGSGWGVYGAMFNSNGGDIRRDFRISNSTVDTQIAPKVAFASNGTFVAVWTGKDISGDGVFARRFDATGNPIIPVGDSQQGEIRLNSLELETNEQLRFPLTPTVSL